MAKWGCGSGHRGQIVRPPLDTERHDELSPRIVSRSVRRCQNLAFKLCGGKRLRIRVGGWRYRETMMTSSLIVAAGTGVRYPAVQRNTPFHS